MASGAAAPPRTRAARQADFDRQIEEKQKELDDGKSSRKDTRREEVEWAAMRKVLEGQNRRSQDAAGGPSAAGREWRALSTRHGPKTSTTSCKGGGARRGVGASQR